MRFCAFFIVFIFSSSAYPQSAFNGTNCYDSTEAPNLVLPFPWNALAEKANEGDSQAQFTVGEYFSNGNIGNFDSALIWYGQSAKQGNISAIFKLASIYAKFGDSVYYDTIETDLVRGFSCFKLAAQQGHMEAQFNLATLYYLGEGTSKDIEEAHKWFSEAARQGNENAIRNRDMVAKEIEATRYIEAENFKNDFYLSEEGSQQRTLFGIGVDGCPVESDRWRSRVESFYNFHLSTGFYSSPNQVNGLCQACVGKLEVRLVQERRYDEQEQLGRIGINACVAELDRRLGLPN